MSFVRGRKSIPPKPIKAEDANPSNLSLVPIPPISSPSVQDRTALRNLMNLTSNDHSFEIESKSTPIASTKCDHQSDQKTGSKEDGNDSSSPEIPVTPLKSEAKSKLELKHVSSALEKLRKYKESSIPPTTTEEKFEIDAEQKKIADSIQLFLASKSYPAVSTATVNASENKKRVLEAVFEDLKGKYDAALTAVAESKKQRAMAKEEKPIVATSLPAVDILSNSTAKSVTAPGPAVKAIPPTPTKAPAIDPVKPTSISSSVASSATQPAPPAKKDYSGETSRPIVFLEFTINGKYEGRVICELWDHEVPITSENFRCLCTHEKVD